MSTMSDITQTYDKDVIYSTVISSAVKIKWIQWFQCWTLFSSMFGWFTWTHILIIKFEHYNIGITCKKPNVALQKVIHVKKNSKKNNVHQDL